MRGALTRLVGAWTLVDYTTSDLDGRHVDRPLGRHARGLLIYTTDGYMSVQIASAGRPHFAAEELHGGTDPERAAAAASYLAYAGRFGGGADGIVTHLADVSLFPNWAERPIVRRMVFRDEDLLDLGIVDPISVNGVARTGNLTWKRAVRVPASDST